MTLRFKLPLLLLPLAAISLMLVGYVCYVKLRDNAEEKTFKQAAAQVAQVASYVKNSVTTARANVSLFADYPTVKFFLLTEDETERYELMQRPVQKTFLDIQKAYPEYYELRLLLPDGFEDIRMVNRDIDNLTEEEGATALFKALQSTSDVYQRFEVNPDNGDLACYLFKKVNLIDVYNSDFSAKPELRGYLAITLDTNTLFRLLEDNPLGGSGGMLLTDTSGQPLLVPSHLKWLTAKKQLVGLLADNVEHHAYHSLLFAEQVYYHSSQQLVDGLWIHSLVPEGELVNASRNIGRLVIGTTFLVFFLSLLIILYLLKYHVLTPLKYLQDAFLRIGDGEELVQIPVIRNDEMGDLGRGLNQMSLALKDSNDKIRSMAFCDNLTQLPNRFMFHKNLKRAMEIALLEDTQLALLFIDLDNFKQVNDTLGHQTGDKLLQEVAARLVNNLRGHDFVSRISTEGDNSSLARLGGDEFTLLVHGLESPMDVKPVAERIIDTITQPFNLAGQDHYIGASIGIAIYPGDGTNSEDLIKHADLAMYEAKTQNKGGYHYFSREISSLALQRTKLEQRLRKAVEEEAFELHYQPIVDCHGLHTLSLEALIRWNDKELGPIPPDRFIPIAEDTGLIHEIGAWVINEASSQLKRWHDSGAKDISVAVNVSGRQLEKDEFFDQLSSCLQRKGIKPGTFYIELTESAIIQGRPEVLETLRKLRAKGVRVALDDFGTGYSSLSYLRNLPIDILKIDRSFIQELGEQNNSVLLSAIITMAQALNLKVIAEGIEEQGQFAFLKKAGCDMLQGYMFSRPQPVTESTERLMNERQNT